MTHCTMLLIEPDRMKYIMMPRDSRIGNKRAADSMLEAAVEIVQKQCAHLQILH